MSAVEFDAALEWDKTIRPGNCIERGDNKPDGSGAKDKTGMLHHIRAQ